MLTLDGYKRYILMFNSTSPGPAIIADQDNNLVIYVTNNIKFNGVSISLLFQLSGSFDLDVTSTVIQEPGETLPDPSTVTGNNINSAVTLDKESYEKSGAFGHAPVLPPVVTPQSERDQNGTGILDLPPISKNLIPESSLPISTSGEGTFDASPTIQSVGPLSTTAQLAVESVKETIPNLRVFQV